MAQQLAGFPKELNQHLSDTLDRDYTAILVITTLIVFPLMWYFQSLPPREMTAEELEELISVIYRVEPQPEIVQVVQERPEEQARARQVTEEEVVEQTVEERQARREQRNQERQQRFQQMREAAMSRGIFAQAGAIQAAGGGRSRGGGRTLGGGGYSGGLGDLSGMASGTEVDAVERIRGGGAVTAGAGDIDFSEMSMEEVELFLEQSTVEVEDVPQTRGSGASSASRDPSVILQMVQDESRSLRDCYNTQKRQDPNLQGRVVVRYTIMGDGSVSRIQIRNAQWSNRSLGSRVESCVQRRVQRWRFDAANGDVTTEFSLVFN